jgi:hypothetical protein
VRSAITVRRAAVETRCAVIAGSPSGILARLEADERRLRQRG